MKIKISKVMKVKTSYSSQRETVVTSSFGACSLAMDDGGRCLLDVINDPKLLQSFLESGSDENSKDPQDGTSSESAVESPQVSNSQVSLANHISSADHIIDAGDQMGYSFVDGGALLAQSGVGSTAAGLGGMPLVVASSTGPQTYQHASSSGATIHHLPSTVTHVNLHPHSPASARSVTPSHNIKSPGMGPSSVHSMPPPSPLQNTRSPLPSHTPSPAPAWSPVPPVLSPAAPRSQSSMPSMSVAFQQTHNQMLQTTCNLAQYVTALASPQSVQKLTLQQQQQQQQQQQVFLQQQLPPASQQQSIPRLTAVQTPVVSTVAVPAPMLHLIQAQASNVAVPTTRTSHNSVRPIQPKIPNIRPKPPACSVSNQFVSPAPTPKQTSTAVTTGQRTVGVGIQPGNAPLVLNQAPPGVFSGATSGTILVNQIIPGVPQSGGPILIHSGNLPSLLLRPTNPSAGQTLNATNSSNNATLIATALQNANQQTLFAPAKQTLHSPQTIVIPNNNLHPGLASQNINLTTAAIPNSGILSSSNQGQNFLARQNFILQSTTRLMGNHQSLQLQQIQTPNGPILALAPAPGQTISLPQLQALSNAQLPVTAVPMQTVMTSQGVLSLQSHTPQSALQQQQQQSLFGTPVPFTNHLEQSSPQVMQVPQPLTPNQVQTNHPGHLQQNQPQQIEHSPKPASPQKPAKAPHLNLEELLKEHGIVPDSPVPSPECNSPLIEEPVPQTIVNSPQLITMQPSQQVVLEQSPGTATLPQLKLTQDGNIKLCNLAIAQDGSVILHPQSAPNNNPTVHHYVSSGQIQGRTVNTTVNSMIFPTAVVSSAASVPVSLESAPRNHSTLIARLNAGPALSVPDVSSLALSAASGTTTLSTSNTTTLVPLVQSLSVTNTPIASSYIVQRTNTLSSAGDRLFVTEDVHTTQSHVTPVISSSSSTQNVQNRVNHSGPFQAIIVPNEHTIRTMPQLPPKTVQSSHVGTVSTTTSPNVQTVVQKVGHKETRVAEVDNGAVVPSHNHPVASSNVPNNILSKIQKEINELTNIRIRNPEQQKILQQLGTLRQKMLTMQNNKSRGNRANQNQYQLKLENDVEKLIQRAQASHSIRSVSPQQVQIKPPILNVQQSGQLEKQQNSVKNPVNSHNLQLVNLLKQNPPHSAPPKHTVHAPTVTTTTVTAACDSTTTTVESSASVHQKSNQVPAPVQPKLQNSHHHQPTKTSSEVTQQQVIVRLQKPPVQQQYIVQTPSNTVQRKAPSPAKRIVNTVLINEQLKKDQNRALNPDVNTPFLSTADACRRLLSYHVYSSREPSEQQLDEEDRAFGLRSENVIRKMKMLFGRMLAVQSKNSSHPKSETPSHEAVQIQRLLIEEEQEAFDAEKAIVADGGTLSIPPSRQAWLEQFQSPVTDDVREETNDREKSCSSPPSACDRFSKIAAEQEKVQRSPSPVHRFSEKDRCVYDQEDHDCLCREASDHPEDSDPLFKEDDNLEAPVIDSCEDIVLPPNDNVERSPPTLKRIVIKPTRRHESDSEDQSPVRKRVKFNNSAVSNLTSSQKYPKHESGDYSNPIHRPEATKQSDYVLSKTNHKVPPMSGPFQSDTRIGDMVTELRKEFNMSPMEMDDDTRVSSHMVDFDPPGGVNHLVDFEPPVPRTEESCDSSLVYNNSLRNNCSDKYGFNLLNDYVLQEYVQQVHQPSESDLAVSSILTNQDNPDLDLSGLDGLEDHLNDDSQHCIPNGIQDVETSEDNEMDFIGYSIPKHQKRFQDSSMQPASNCSGTGDQVQCAIRSITEADTRFDRVHTHTDFMSLNRHSQNAHIGGYGSSTSSGMGSSSRRRQHDVDEAVNSILM